METMQNGTAPRLGQVEAAVEQALASVLQRENALAGCNVSARAAELLEVLPALVERAHQLDALRGCKDEVATEVDALLRDEESRLRQQLSQLTGLRNALADWGRRAIG